ncbi:hypothetical protein H7200_01725 [Candidatus Saccharibacteria bacterium]|nr:hypothetical protein [Candidatus Saccharibacteria bacterium]
MSISEQADYSAERIEKPRIIKTIESERSTVGSTRDYIHATGVYYQSVPEHSANMLQLQRIAHLLTNPDNEPVATKNVTNAFYWGEILGYAIGDRMDRQWASMSYSAFNKNVLKNLKDNRDTSMTPRENLQYTVDLMMGDLEQRAGAAIPPEFENMIQEWAEELSQDSNDQMHIIMGFRFIMQQISYPDKGSVAFANTFYDMMDKNEIDDLMANEVEDLHDVQEALLDRYVDHRMRIGEFDETNPKNIADVTEYLSRKLSADLVEIEGVDDGDDVMVRGNAMYVVIDTETGVQTFAFLGLNEVLKGTIDSVIVMPVPTNESIPILRRHLDDRTTDISRVGENTFGVVMILRHPILRQPSGKHLPAKGDVVAGVVMNNPSVEILKFI